MTLLQALEATGQACAVLVLDEQGRLLVRGRVAAPVMDTLRQHKGQLLAILTGITDGHPFVWSRQGQDYRVEDTLPVGRVGVVKAGVLEVLRRPSPEEWL